MKRLVWVFAICAMFVSFGAYAQCAGGANGTPQTPAYIFSNEFQNGRAAGSITPDCMRDLYASRMNWQLNAQTANYTLAASDDGKIVTMNVSGDSTLTLPLNATIAIPVGFQTRVRNIGAYANLNQLVITPGTTAVQIDTNGSWVMTDARQDWILTKVATDEWTLTGNAARLLHADYTLTTTDQGGSAGSGAGISSIWGLAGGTDAFACGASTFNDARITYSATGGPNNGPYRTLNVVAGDNYSGNGLRCEMGALEMRWGEMIDSGYTVYNGGYNYTQGTFSLFKEGQHKITEFDIRIPSSWTLSQSAQFQLVAQWKQCQPDTQAAGSPALNLNAQNNQWQLQGDPGTGTTINYTSSNISTGTWYHIKMDVYWSQFTALGWAMMSSQASGSVPQLSPIVPMRTLEIETGTSDPIILGGSIPACLLAGPYARSAMPTTSLDMTNFQVWDAN